MRTCSGCGFGIADDTITVCPVCGMELSAENRTESANSDRAVSSRKVQSHTVSAQADPLNAGGQNVVIFQQQTPDSPKSRTAALLLLLFLGLFGFHRFYVGKAGTGILYLLTIGFVGIGVVVDFILIITGVFKDSKGKQIKNW